MSDTTERKAACVGYDITHKTQQTSVCPWKPSNKWFYHCRFTPVGFSWNLVFFFLCILIGLLGVRQSCGTNSDVLCRYTAGKQLEREGGGCNWSFIAVFLLKFPLLLFLCASLFVCSFAITAICILHRMLLQLKADQQGNLLNEAMQVRLQGTVHPKMKIWCLSANPPGPLRCRWLCFFSRTQTKMFNSNHCSQSYNGSQWDPRLWESNKTNTDKTKLNPAAR